jgi:hypothetical protein
LLLSFEKREELETPWRVWDKVVCGGGGGGGEKAVTLVRPRDAGGENR